ncbi:CAP-Gly domain-containing linker protein 1-like [Rhipicephalus sanguineus]|uniref:CAP-Gly domain-containing linker protein 1-like n=1 Tax=Rhipicephalus sanguineus TaxID=34632 RepID=UPI001894CBB2|nr:CAP-Gly domain-containing linker protein 1-like [Rhipicephalus sanguineus]
MTKAATMRALTRSASRLVRSRAAGRHRGTTSDAVATHRPPPRVQRPGTVRRTRRWTTRFLGTRPGTVTTLKQRSGSPGNDDDAATVNKRKKTRNARRKRKKTEHRDTKLTPDESESGTDVVRARDLERDKAALEAEVDRPKHEHDIYKARATIIINEKDRHISHLMTRSALWRNSSNSSFEAKTSWSDKIHTLEAQIFNLNRKVTEDSLEYSRMERLLADAQQRFKDQQQQCAKFEGQLLERDTQLANMRHSHQEQLQRQRALQDSQLDELRMQAADLRAQLTQAQQDRDREASAARTLIVELSQKEAECKKNQEQIQGLKQGQRTLLAQVSELQAQLSLASDSETILKHGLKRSEAVLETMQEELAKLKQVLASAEIENKRLIEELEARQQQADKEQFKLKAVTQLLESRERTAEQVDPLEEEPAAQASNCASVSDLSATSARETRAPEVYAVGASLGTSRFRGC